MLQFPRFRSSVQNNQKTSRKASLQSFRNALALSLAALLFFVPLGFTVSAQQPPSQGKSSYSGGGDHFMLYQNEAGDTVCRTATPAEKSMLNGINTTNPGLHRITHVGRESISSPDSMNAETADNSAAQLTIVLLGTAQLESFPEAKAAFIRAAQSWENIIKSPVTIYLDADYGTTNFGTPWPTDVLGSTSSPSISTPYQTVRSSLITSASNSAEASLYNSLPSTGLPTDAGVKTNMTVSSSIARAIGLLNATALESDSKARIGFNSNFQFDFNRADGISSGKTDFESVAAHEIGHALGFTSRAGSGTNTTPPAIWDIFRFRTGMTVGTFGSAQRVMASDGLQYYFSGPAEQGLSTGGPNGEATGGDGNQSSHWKQANLNGGVYIGIMDPRIPSARTRLITTNDITALNSFGYNLENSQPPPPPPPPPAAPANDNFANAIVISGCSGSIPGTNISATKEAGEPNHADIAGGASVWYRWQAPSNSSVTITTDRSDYDTILGVYKGNSVNDLTFVAGNDDVVRGEVISSTVTFEATAGTVYRIAVDGYSQPGFSVDTGSIVLNWNQSNCTTTPANPIDGSQFFVGQHYQDFLGRQPDAGGLQYWSEQISGNVSNAPPPCPPGDAVCVHIRRINVSAAFFVENEFQRTGGFVVRFYKASYGTRPSFQQFTSDRGQVFEGDGLEARKQTFAANWVQRPEFLAKYPASLNGPAFVDAIILNIAQNSNVDISGQRANLIADFNTGGRAQVVRSVADNGAFAQAEYNAAFVVMQYFGYLQRSPDDGGYQFWLGILNNKAPNNFRAMVCAFLTSTEYQQRFGSTITRTNNDCANVGP
jgi:hypothetical protein